MSSSANDYSDGGDADELQNDCETISYTAMMETADAVNTTPTPTVPYTVLPHVGAMTPAAYPYADPYYRSMFAPYDSQAYAAHPYAAHPMVHLQLMGVQQPGVPLPSDAVEEPVFVNAKQYHGIMRRRQSRAKAESERKAFKARKPYLHESRHLHAVRRARGCGGRFVNSKKDVPKELAASDPNLKDEATSKDSSQSVGPHDVNKTGTESN